MSTDLDTEKRNRLIVLLPSTMVNDTQLAYTIHWEASREGKVVYYLTINTGKDEQLTLSRRMATLKSVTAGNHVEVHWIEAASADWSEKLLSIYRPGDTVACLQGHTVSNSPARVPINEYLKYRFDIKAKLIPGFSTDIKNNTARGIPEIVKFAGFLLITGLFTWFQYTAYQALSGFYQTLVFLTSLVVELVVISAWSNFKNT